MKRILNSYYQSPSDASDKSYRKERNNRKNLAQLEKAVVIILLLLITITGLKAQSGGWDASSSTGVAGYTDHGNGVIQLLDVNSTNGCQAAAVHETSDTYDPTTDGVFNKCFQVFFGCPGDDEIGSDLKGDGMAFSFWKSSAIYNINNGLACGGGLGYMGSSSDNKMITIEFDTWSSQGNINFDNAYEGTGNGDQVAIHRDGDASNTGKIAGANAGNLEDGLEHTVCINYDPATNIMTVSIDGNNVLVHDLSGSGYELQTYFGVGELNQTWSSGKFDATNPATVTNGEDISDNLGGPLCPASVIVTSPSGGAIFETCDGPITITAATTPPAGNTVDSVEFFIDGVKISVDNTGPYETIWSSLTEGNHTITAVAHYMPSGTSSTSSPVIIAVSQGMQKTSTVPAVDGTAEALWGNYPAFSLDEIPVGIVSGPADASATYQVTYDANSLYILVEVTDEDLSDDGGDQWDDDGVEVFIDMGNDKNGTYGLSDFQYAFVYNRANATEYKHNALTGVTFAQGAKAGGYVMEISIPWSTLGGAPINGDLIGFDVHVNDDDGGGARDSKIAWNDATDLAHSNPSAFGTIKASGCEPCPTSTAGSAQNLCNVTSVTLDGNTINAPSIGVWTLVSGPNTPGITTPASPNSEVTGMIAGTYVFQWTVSNGACTDAISDVTITISAQPTADAGTTQNLCNVTTTNLSATAVIAPATGAWSLVSGPNTPSITSLSNENSEVTGMVAGTYEFEWTVSNGSCTDATSDVTIVNSVTPLATSAGSDQPLLCLDNSTLSAGIPAAGTTGLWNVVSGVFTITDAADPATTITNIPVGTIELEWITSSGSCEPARDTVVITRNPEVTVAAAGDNGSTCGSSIELNGNVVAVGIGTWSSANPLVSFENSNDPKTVVSGLSNGVNQLVWTVTGTCGGPSSDAVDILVDASSVTVVADAAQDTLCLGLTADISATVSGTIATPFTYTWTSSDGSFNTVTTSSSISVIPVAAGWTNYTVSVVDANGCSASPLGEDSLYAVNQQTLVVPNMITPNGDYRNDCLLIRDVNDFDIIPGSQVNLFNRWGQAVYNNDAYKNGDFCGSTLPDGTYYYYIKTSCDHREIVGWLHIISNEASNK